jgi:hypothetical protein
MPHDPTTTLPAQIIAPSGFILDEANEQGGARCGQLSEPALSNRPIMRSN